VCSSDLNGSAKYIHINFNGNTLDKEEIPVKSILIEKPFFSFYIFKNTIPPNDKTKPQFLTIPLKLKVSNLKLVEGRFKFRDENGSSVAYKHHVAFSDLDVSKININDKYITFS
jgi:lipopolysaccharide biosynthesis glycosyltransferase